MKRTNRRQYRRYDSGGVVLEAVRRACALGGEGSPTPDEKLAEILTKLRDYSDTVGEVVASEDVRLAAMTEPNKVNGNLRMIAALQYAAMVCVVAMVGIQRPFNDLGSIVWQIEKLKRLDNPYKRKGNGRD